MNKELNIVINFIELMKQSAENKYELCKHRPLSEAAIEAETSIAVCNNILNFIKEMQNK